MPEVAPTAAAGAPAMASAPSPLTLAGDGVRLSVRLQPGASRNEIAGVALLADGRAVLRVRVGAPPEGGKANAALLALLAKRWGLPKTSLSLAAGQRDRLKTVAVAGDPAALRDRLQAWLDWLARDKTR